MRESDRAPQKILVIDDEDEVLEGILSSLRKSEFTAVGVNSALEARLELERGDYRILLCDEGMPGVRGTDFLAEVGRVQPGIGRVLMSGILSFDIALDAINQARVQRLLVKPFSSSELLEALRAVDSSPPSAVDARTRAKSQLSAREYEIFSRLAKGERITQIARRFFLSTHTVRNHLKAIFRKLDLHSQEELLDRFGARSVRHGR